MASHLLVGNPTAQSGKNAARIAAARQLLDGAGIVHDFVATAPRGATVGIVADALRSGAYRSAIYMGGDGTFAEVAKGILGSARDVALGMLPTGTANDQGKSFGLGSGEDDLARNIEVVGRNRRTRLDVGRLRAGFDGKVIREDLFFDSAGWGISPRTLALRNEDRKAIEDVPLLSAIYRDELVYAGALLRTFLSSYFEDHTFDVHLDADGRSVEWRGLTDLVIKGTRVYGGAWVLAPEARWDDGQFEIIPFVGKRDWLSKVILHLDQTGATGAALDEIGVHHSEATSARRMRLEFSAHDVPLAAQIDGEEFPATPVVEVEVLPRALAIVVPEEFADPE